MHKYIYL